MRYEDKIDDEMFKSMVYYKRERKVRQSALKVVATTNTDARILPGIFSESNSVQRLCARQLTRRNPEMQ